MPAITKLLTFDEFRAATGVEADALRQQRAFFQDMAATQEVLGSGIAARGWAEWPQTSAKGGASGPRTPRVDYFLHAVAPPLDDAPSGPYIAAHV